MSYDKLKKLGGGSGSYKYENPYTKKEPVKGPSKQQIDEMHGQKAEAQGRSILDQNNYLLSQLYELKRSQDDLRYDIVSILMLIEAKEQGQEELFKISAQALREKYFGFRASKKHVLNRIIDKTEAIIKKDLNFNADNDSGESA